MILTEIDTDALPETLERFGAMLTTAMARQVFRRIAMPQQARRATHGIAPAHHREAIRIALQFGMDLLPGSPRQDYGWNGRALRIDTEAYVLLHEVAHFQLAAPKRRRLIDFGLGAGPETGDSAGAEQAAVIHGLAREGEEALASLLGILWESTLGQPALASFLDQNWLEGAPRPSAVHHFERALARLQHDGFTTPAGDPTRRLRFTPDGMLA